MKQALFESWCLSQGIWSPLKLQGADSRYRYMSCPDGDVTGDLLKVPLDACITADSSEALAERLVYEKTLGSKSQYAPFLELMPNLEDLSDMPRFWSASRLEKVKDGGQLEQRMKMSINKEVDPWALACVNSRANYLDDFSYSLTPVLDMINHDASVGTKAKIMDDNLVLTIDKTFSAGEEVFISYGDLTNLDTLSDYGFVAVDNPCNAESFVLNFIRQPPIGVIIDKDGSINLDAIAKLREYVATSQGLDSGGDDLFLLPISDSNEEEVYSYLATYLQEAIDEARIGAKNAPSDDLVSTYLSERAKTLEKGIKFIDAKFPLLEY